MNQSVLITTLIEGLDLLGEPVFILDLSSATASGNRAFKILLGHETSTLSLQSFWPGFLESEFRGETSISKLRTNSGEFVSAKLISKELSNDLFFVRVIASRNISDSDQGLQLQRREMLGALAGGISHDMNNIITGILGHCAYLKMTLPKTGPHVDSIEAIQEGGNRSAQLSSQILSFIRQNTSNESCKVDFCQVVDSTVNLLKGAISKKIRLVHEVPKMAVNVNAIEGQLAQVLVNLVVNARDAIGDSGEIRIVLRELETCKVIDPVGEMRGSDRLKGKYACLSVIDNGQGIPKEIIGKVFEPYFSTKPDKGTGLGLSTVKEIVEKFEGVIEISSKSAIGTKVSVYFPVIDENVNIAGQTASEIQGGKEKILIVDDEQAIRNVLSLSLRRLGYDVEMAASGSEAISKYIADNYDYDLVILDMVMPELSGSDIFFRLKELNPNVRVLICTAFASEQAIRDILDNGGKGLIHKPFDIEELANKLRECLS